MRGRIGLRIYPSKMISANTSEMSEEVSDRSASMREARKNGRNPKAQPLMYPHMYAYVHDIARVKRTNANLTTLRLRDEDIFDQRQSLRAAEASRFFQSASEKRDDHNDDYIGHWPREKRDGHEDAVKWARDNSVRWENESRKHRNVCRLAHFERSFADSDSPAMIAGVTDGSRIWTNIFQKTITEAFKSLTFASGSGMFL